jgi:arylsulfatase A-like enzyme
MKYKITALLLCALATALPSQEKPNILYLFADDLCFETIGTLGLTDIDTPNLDGLAAKGTYFHHAYNMGSWSGAVCVASRHMLITGRYLWHANEAQKNLKAEQAKEVLWPQLMGKAGYDTYFTGKWHIRAKPEEVFTKAKNVRGGMPNQTPQGYNRPLAGQEDPWDPTDPKFGGFWKGGKHWSEVVAEDTLEFLDDAQKSKNPFFMYIAFNAAHDPRQSPREYINMYPLDRIKIPENFLPEYPYKDKIGSPHSLRDEKLAPMPRTEHSIKVHRQEYYALISHMDAQIGRILDGLEKSGKADNTYIFFTADHGLAVGHHGLVGKQNLYEHSIRVPFIAAGPGIPSGKKVDAPIYLQDVMPTSLKLAGADKPSHVQFHDILPLAKGEQTAANLPAVYGAYLGLQRSVTQAGKKLILYPEVPVARLYDIVKDPLEMDDLAKDGKNLPLQKELFSKFLQLQKDTGDTLDLIEKFPKLL